MADERIILINLEEYMEIAEYAFNKQKFNTSVTLHYKALVEICDLTLLRSANKIGANHTERFNLLKEKSPALFHTASKLFRFYRDAYNKEISKTIAILVKKEVENAKHDFI